MPLRQNRSPRSAPDALAASEELAQTGRRLGPSTCWTSRPGPYANHRTVDGGNRALSDRRTLRRGCVRPGGFRRTIAAPPLLAGRLRPTAISRRSSRPYPRGVRLGGSRKHRPLPAGADHRCTCVHGCAIWWFTQRRRTATRTGSESVTEVAGAAGVSWWMAAGHRACGGRGGRRGYGRCASRIRSCAG